MACHECDHTMRRVEGFWCPRCGSIKFGGGVEDTPFLALQIHDFLAGLDGPKKKWVREEFRRLGIIEALCLDEEKEDTPLG